MKKIALLLTCSAIIYLSNVPYLQVSSPQSWVNPPQYEQNVMLSDILKTNSVFYNNYKNIYYKEFLLHKLGHLIFYSLLTYMVWINVTIKKWKATVVFGFVLLFAFTDEVHQYFVSGRSGRLADVILDMIFSFIILMLIKKTKK